MIPPRTPGTARVVAIGDPHLEGRRFSSDLPLWDAVIAGIVEADPHLIVIVGDLIGGHDTSHVTSVEERAALDPRWRRLSDVAPLHIIRGNHDDPRDLGRLESLRGRHPIRVHQGPGLHSIGIEGVVLAALPYPDKGRALGGVVPASHGEESEIVSSWLRARLAALGDAVRRRRATGPVDVILAGHVSISGALPGGGEVYMPGDGAVTPGDLASVGADLTIMGHIHAPQQIGPSAHILGSLRELGHGEGGEGRWWWAFDLGGGVRATHRVPSGWRPKRTVRARWDGVALSFDERPPVDDADVRVIVEADAEHERTIPPITIDGAASVRVERRIARPATQARASGLSRATTDLDRLLTVAPLLGEQIDTARAVRLGSIIDDVTGADPVAELDQAFPGLVREV